MALPKTRRVALLLMALGGCSPALDWREVRVDESALKAQFPCRPERRVREVSIEGMRSRMEMVTCTADGTTFAGSHFTVRDPAGVSSAMDAVKAASVSNLGGPPPKTSPFQLAGMTPNPSAARLDLTGRRPDGEVVDLHSAFFSRGLRIYQMSVLGKAPPQHAVDTFFAGLAFR